MSNEGYAVCTVLDMELKRVANNNYIMIIIQDAVPGQHFGSQMRPIGQ